MNFSPNNFEHAKKYFLLGLESYKYTLGYTRSALCSIPQNYLLS